MARTGKGSSGKGSARKGGGGAGGSSSASAGAIRAGAAFVELYSKDNKLTDGLNAASSKLKAWASTAAKAGALVIGAGAGILAPMIVSADQFIERGDKIKKASDRLGISAESLSALGYAAQQSGTDLEGLEKGIRKLQQHVDDAAGGSAEAAQSFTELGLIAQDLADMKPDEMFLKIADAIAEIDNPAERTNKVIKAFGKSGAELIPLLLGGSKGVRALMEEAAEVGSIFTTDEAAAAERIGDSLDRTWTATKNILKSVGSALVPVTDQIESLSFVILGHIRVVREWIEGNKEVVLTVAAVGAGLVALGAGILGLAGIMHVAGTAIGMIGTAVGVMLSPFGLLTAAVAAGGLAWIAFSDNGADSLIKLWEKAKEVFGSLQGGWQGVKDAMEAGDFTLAAKLAFASLNLAWRQMTDGMQTAWKNSLAWMKDALIGWTLIIKDLFAYAIGIPAALMGKIGEMIGALPEGTAKSIQEDMDRELKLNRDEAVAASQKNAADRNRAIDEQASKLKAAQDELASLRQKAKEANAKGGRDLPEGIFDVGGYKPFGVATSNKGGFNIGGESSSFFGGGGSTFGKLLKVEENQEAILKTIAGLIGGIPPLRIGK